MCVQNGFFSKSKNFQYMLINTILLLLIFCETILRNEKQCMCLCVCVICCASKEECVVVVQL